jgi:streptomycin 6-kinase
VTRQKNPSVFDDPVRRWALVPDGGPVFTETSALLPVLFDGAPAMLKVALHEEERRGNGLMQWWAGGGAAPVLASDGDALLMPRAEGGSLEHMPGEGQDDEATHILCDVARRLHAPRPGPMPDLVPLPAWFEALDAAAGSQGGAFRLAAELAHSLLASEGERVALHGDLHHGNVLDFGAQGWLAIDPKGLIGERVFDYANLLRNPDPATAASPGRLARRVAIVAAQAGLERRRLLAWLAAFAGLSASWLVEEGERPDEDLAIVAIAAAEAAR